MSHINTVYQGGLGLLTDLYQLTMAYGYWKSELYQKKAAFHLYFRENPFQGKYAICSGLELAIDLLQRFSFSTGDIQYLGGLTGANGRPLFDESFLNHLQRMEFNCDIDAIPEGTIVFANQPLVRVVGPIIQAQLIETALLNLINFSTLLATKSSRVVAAAQGDSVLEFGLRRAQGLDGGITASRAAYIGGCHATSNVMAGKSYNIPVKGTHAHSWVMCFEEEITAFREYAKALPNNCIFLVDTYDTIEGVGKAIKVGKELREEGHEMVGIRLDSGDLGALSIEARKMLDEGGFPEAVIVASDNLDERTIRSLKEEGAQIKVWGVGTKLATSYDQPALGGVYKLAAIEKAPGQWSHRMKLSERGVKTSTPGILQVNRFFNAEGTPVGDQLFDTLLGETSSEIYWDKKDKKASFEGFQSEKLLQPIFREGKLIYNLPAINEIRNHSLRQQQLFRLVDWKKFALGVDPALQQLKSNMIKKQERNYAT